MKALELGLVVAWLVSIGCGSARAQSWDDIGTILTMSGIPTIGYDGRIYVCVDDNLVVYNSDRTVNWTAVLRVGYCERRVPPIVDTDGRVYLATQNRVQVIVPRPYSTNSKKYTVQFLYNITSMRGNNLGSKTITGLAAATSNAAVTFYINTGVGGLYAVTVDGIPRWSIGGNTTNTTSDWMKTDFTENSFCPANTTGCYFHFSPAVDLCDGTIYIAHSTGWLYAIAGWQPFIRWRYNLGISGQSTEACVTAGNNGLVYVAVVAQQSVYALDGSTGTLQWKVRVGPMSILTCFPRTDVTGWVYMGSADGILYAITPNGDKVNQLMLREAADSVIQTSPYIECKGGVAYVAHIQVRSKTITRGLSSSVVSYSDALSIRVSQVSTATGAVFWKEMHPGNMTSGGGRTFDSSLILAITAENVAATGPCKNSEMELATSCQLDLSLDELPAMSTKKFKGYYIGLPMVFIGCLAVILSLYAYWSYRIRVARRKAREERRKDMGVPKDKDKLVKRRNLLDHRATVLRAEFSDNPDSPMLLEELRSVLAELSFLEALIANQSHVTASQHGIRRRLEATHYGPTWGGFSSPSSYGGEVPFFSGGTSPLTAPASRPATPAAGIWIDGSPAPVAGTSSHHSLDSASRHQQRQDSSSSSDDVGGLDAGLMTSFADDPKPQPLNAVDT